MNVTLAGVAELADATDSKSVSRKGVWVRPPPPVGFAVSESLQKRLTQTTSIHTLKPNLSLGSYLLADQLLNRFKNQS